MNEPKKSFFDFFILEPESLRLARILLGLLSFFYFFGIFQEVDVFFSAKAIVPYETILRLSPEYSLLPLLKISQSSTYVYSLALTGLISSVMIAIGFIPKAFIVITWLLTMAFSSRFPDLSFAADNTLKLTLFWFFFLQSEQENPKRYKAIHLMWTVQIFLMYEFSVYQKIINPHWFGLYDSLYYVSKSSHLLKPAGELLAILPYSILQLLTVLTLLLEILGPLGLFIPHKKTRSFIVWIFILFHFLIWLMLDVGLFSLLCLLWWSSLLPSEFWNRKPVKIISNWLARGSQIKGIKSYPVKPWWQKGEFIFLASIFFLILLQSVNQITGFQLYSRKALPSVVVNRLQVKPNWNMFTENPPVGYDGWFIAETVLSDGSLIDLFTLKNPVKTKPQDHSSFYPTIHWRLFLRKFRSKHPDQFAHYYGNYLCQQGQKQLLENKSKIVSLKLFFIKNEIGNAYPDTIKEELLIDKQCP